jgi:hypothetical protein
MKELFTIEGRAFGPWFDSVRDRIKYITEESKNRTGPVKRYLVKHVWAASLAHSLSLQPSEKTSPYEAIALDRDNLRVELEQERQRIRVKVVEVDSTPHSVKIIKLMASATDARPAPGVYLLLNKSGEVVYVGQSRNVLSRMVGHQEKEFQTVKMIHIKEERERLEIEGVLIKTLAPVFNVQGLGFRREIASAKGVSFQ